MRDINWRPKSKQRRILKKWKKRRVRLSLHPNVTVSMCDESTFFSRKCKELGLSDDFIAVNLPGIQFGVPNANGAIFPLDSDIHIRALNSPANTIMHYKHADGSRDVGMAECMHNLYGAGVPLPKDFKPEGDHTDDTREYDKTGTTGKE